MHEFVRHLTARLPGRVAPDAPLAPFTTLKVGGSAAALVTAEDPEDLAVVGEVCVAFGRPWLVLGRGSNLLVADTGWPGAVITLGRGFRGVDVHGETVRAGAAEPMPVLATRVAREGLAGFAFGVAIPGTVGGAVRMNAGAHGREMRDVLVDAEVVSLPQATRATLTRDELQMEYRHTALPRDAVVVAARLRLQHAAVEQIREEMDEMRRWRRAAQPINEPSCGSVFRNPPGDSAGRLIEQSGLKGLRVGAAEVSPVHANFITARPGATATDVHEVIRTVQQRVEERTGVRLETEVVLAGFDHEQVGG